MHPQHLRDRARELFRDGRRIADIARELDLHYRTVYDCGPSSSPPSTAYTPSGARSSRGCPRIGLACFRRRGRARSTTARSSWSRGSGTSPTSTRERCCGLFHSDGCRAANRIHKDGKSYVYPRYFFNNRSEGVLDICRTALGRLGIELRTARPDSLSVARRGAVAQLDRWVGP